MDALSFAATKIQPPRPRATRIARPRLEAAFEAALGDMRVVLLLAPAGFGKTSLLGQCARVPEGGALAWVSLDEDDDTPRLFACLAAALEPFDLPWRSAPGALRAQVGDDGAGAQRAVAELVNALAGAEVTRGVIVLDDLHRVQSPPLHRLLDALIERLPPHWTLVLSSRVEPPISLARWRAAGELLDIGQEQLRFDDAEAAALLRAEAAPALDGRVDEILARTQGWPAGLRLCLAALRDRPAAGLPARGSAAVDRTLFDYLASEVLDDMPAGLHDFLVRASVLPVLTAERAAAVTGDVHAAERLDEVERRGLFATPLDAPERTLVLHDLFRDALDDRLRKRFPGELPSLLLRAAAGETDPVRRVGFELRAGDWAAAERTLVEAAEEMMLQGLAGEVMRLAAQFPAEWRQGSSRLLRLQGLAACLRWQWSEMATSMRAAVAAAQARADEAELRLCQVYLVAACHALGRLDEARALMDSLDGQPLEPHAAVLLLDAQSNQLFQRHDYVPLPALYARLMDRLEQLDSLFAWWECSPPASWSTLPGIGPLLDRFARHALRLCGERELPLKALLHSLQAYLALWAGRADEAVALMETARSDARWFAGSAEIGVNIEVLEAIVSALRGRVDETRERLQALFVREDAHASPERARHWHHQVAVFGIRLADALGLGLAELRHWAPHLTPVPPDAPPRPLPARLAAAEGHWEDAAARFDALLPHAPRLDLMGQAVELHLRAAHAALRCGRPADAARTMRPALVRIRDEGVPGHALMAGPAVLGELAAAPWGDRLDASEQALLHRLVALSAHLRGEDLPPTSRGEGAAAPAAVDEGPLSAREREVLEQLAAGASNKVIARVLDISPHTVKRHVANILDKLALSSRGQAAAWLREHAGA
jgi:LuxR family maltose regulon positive regulatory protein